MSSDPELDVIVQRACAGCRVVAKQPLSGGISARAVRVALVTREEDELDVVVRRPSAASRDAARLVAENEERVLSFAHANRVPVPRPRHFDHDAAALVLDHVPGEPDFAPRDLSNMLRQMATVLARLHRLPLVSALNPLPQRHDQLRATLEKAPAHFDSELNEEYLRQVLAEHFPWTVYNSDALLHGDYWPGNIVWQDGTLAAVLDWEEASIGDPLADVALARLDVLWAFGADAMTEFTRHYREQTTLDWRNLPYWDLSIALRPMSNLTRWASAYAPPPISRPDISAETMRDGHRRFVAQALERLQNR